MSVTINCEHCGKKLIEQDVNGLWHFSFGKAVDEDTPPVEFYIFGSIKMRCLRKSCRKWNVLTVFPQEETDGT